MERNGFHTPAGSRTGSHQPGLPRPKQRPRANQEPTTPPAAEQVSDLPLVEEDGLWFSVVTVDAGGTPHPLLDEASVAKTFRSAFTEVWSRIPTADCQRLLNDWRGDRDVRAARGWTRQNDPLPQIQIVMKPMGDSVEIGCWGSDVSFPAALVTGHPDRLVSEIAHALARVLRLATREHWRLILAMIEEPLERWECELAAEPTEEQRDAKLDELERDYLTAYDAQVAKILAGWGIRGPRPLPPGSR